MDAIEWAIGFSHEDRRKLRVWYERRDEIGYSRDLSFAANNHIGTMAWRLNTETIHTLMRRFADWLTPEAYGGFQADFTAASMSRERLGLFERAPQHAVEAFIAIERYLAGAVVFGELVALLNEHYRNRRPTNPYLEKRDYSRS